MTELHSDDLCGDCGKDFLLHCICEDMDSDKEMDDEMARESRYCLEPMESSPDADYGTEHDWENCDYGDD